MEKGSRTSLFLSLSFSFSLTFFRLKSANKIIVSQQKSRLLTRLVCGVRVSTFGQSTIAT